MVYFFNTTMVYGLILTQGLFAGEIVPIIRKKTMLISKFIPSTPHFPEKFKLPSFFED